MGQVTFQKADYTWYGISIMEKDNLSTDIFLLFKNLDKGNEFFKLITKDNKQPSFHCTQQADKTHTLKIDFTSINNQDDYLQVHCNLTVLTYPPLGFLKEKKKYKIIIGTEMIQNGQVQTMGTDMNFIPSSVQYLDSPDIFKVDQKNQN